MTSQTGSGLAPRRPPRVSMATKGRDPADFASPAFTRVGLLMVLVTVQVRSRGHLFLVPLGVRQQAARLARKMRQP